MSLAQDAPALWRTLGGEGVRYTLTTLCIQKGTMTLTRSLREHLQGRERVRFVDEDGEVHPGEVDWKEGVIRGLAAYYAKRRLSANEAILLHFRGEEVELRAEPRHPLRPEAPASPPPPPAPEPLRRRVRVAPYPREVLFPHEPPEPPGATEDLKRLGFALEGGPPWAYRARLGARDLLLFLVRPEEGGVEALRPYREKGLAALLLPEARRLEAPKGFPYLTPEALARLARLRARLPVTPLDLEALLLEGGVDLERVEALEDRLVAQFADKGTLAALLLLLAQRPLGQVLYLHELEAEAQEEGLSREAVRQGVEALSLPPFGLLRRLSPGEFLLQRGIEEALEDLKAFADGLLRRLSLFRAAV